MEETKDNYVRKAEHFIPKGDRFLKGSVYSISCQIQDIRERLRIPIGFLKEQERAVFTCKFQIFDIVFSETYAESLLDSNDAFCKSWNYLRGNTEEHKHGNYWYFPCLSIIRHLHKQSIYKNSCKMWTSGRRDKEYYEEKVYRMECER